MPGASNDDRPPMVVAMRWVHQITSIAIEMGLPAFLGHLADVRWGTEPWLVAVGALLGFAIAMVHLLSLAKQSNRGDAVRSRRGQGPNYNTNTEHGRNTDRGAITDRDGES